MLNLKTIALAAALTFSAGSVALAAESALDALSSATTVSFQTVAGADAINVAPGGANGELVDLASLKARIQGDPKLLAQLESYGASIDDVVGISATSEQDVTIYVQG
jgi:phage-related baseplate assembly protein